METIALSYFIVCHDDVNHLLGELELNDFKFYDAHLPLGKLLIKEGDEKEISGFLPTKDTSWNCDVPFYV